MHRNMVGALLLSLSWDEDTITVTTDRGTFTGLTYGDCCSTTWIEHVEDSRMAGDALITFADDVGAMDSDRPDPEWTECVKYYGFKIETDKGTILIDYRNSSNGYYGGSLDWRQSE